MKNLRNFMLAAMSLCALAALATFDLGTQAVNSRRWPHGVFERPLPRPCAHSERQPLALSRRSS